jgi:hypothetical protein
MTAFSLPPPARRPDFPFHRHALLKPALALKNSNLRVQRADFRQKRPQIELIKAMDSRKSVIFA